MRCSISRLNIKDVLIGPIQSADDIKTGYKYEMFHCAECLHDFHPPASVHTQSSQQTISDSDSSYVRHVREISPAEVDYQGNARKSGALTPNKML